MHCEQTAELLPWLLNGTLDADEARQVRQHLAGCSECREALRQTRTAWALQEGHLPVAAIVDYSLGVQQEPELRGLIERHLDSCPRCTAELDQVRRGPEHATLDAAGDQRRGATRRVPFSGRAKFWRYAALAATVAALLIGGGWLRSARQQQALTLRLAELTAPRLNIPVIELVPSTTGTVLRGENATANELSNEAAIPAAAREVLLLLLSGGDVCAADCAVEILATQDQPVWRAGGLVPDGTGHLTLVLPRNLVPAGSFTVQVFDPSTPDLLIRYVVDAGEDSP